jgi:hypothetical protein
MSDPIKFYKNPQRTQEVVKVYTPQYQALGLEPKEHKGSTASAIATPSADNPRVRKPVVRQQPYAETSPSPLGRGKGPMLNVGNNVEHTWAGVDAEVIDDLTDTPLDPNHTMVDNNEYVSAAAFGVDEEDLPTLDEVKNPPRRRFTREEVSVAFNKGYNSVQIDSLDHVLHELEEGAYLLLANSVPVCSGPLEEVQEQARLLVFGEHELCDGNPIPIDDIVILKRAKVKVGLFLE